MLELFIIVLLMLMDLQKCKSSKNLLMIMKLVALNANQWLAKWHKCYCVEHTLAHFKTF